jgi:hypothetical protein
VCNAEAEQDYKVTDGLRIVNAGTFTDVVAIKKIVRVASVNTVYIVVHS